MSNKVLKTLLAAMLLNVVAVVATGEVRAEQRSFTIAAMEPKGSATVDKEPFPTATLPAGAGYSLNKPDQSGRWEVEVYVFMPSQIIVNQGDDVTLNFGRHQRCEPSDRHRRLQQIVPAETWRGDVDQLQG